jgi:hypothetical protein
MMQDNNQQPVFQDPKTVVILSLNTDLENIYKTLNSFGAKGVDEAGKMMLNFIQRLNIANTPENKDILYVQQNSNMAKLTSCAVLAKRDNPCYRGGMSFNEIWQIWRLLSDFMNRTYFKGFEFGGKPEQSTPGNGARMGSRY